MYLTLICQLQLLKLSYGEVRVLFLIKNKANIKLTRDLLTVFTINLCVINVFNFWIMTLQMIV